jgi:hypothetical protein
MIPRPKLYLSLITLFLTTMAHAEVVQALKIKSDYFPNLSYEVGFDINAKNSVIDRVYFNEANQEPTFFTLGDLQKEYVTVFRKWGFNFVKIKILRMTSETSGVLEISILKYAVVGTRESLYYDVHLDPSTGRYEIIDRRNHRPLKEALVRTNYKLGVPVGIKDIQGQ